MIDRNLEPLRGGVLSLCPFCFLEVKKIGRHTEPSWFTIIAGFLAVISIIIIAITYPSNHCTQYRTIHHKR